MDEILEQLNTETSNTLGTDLSNEESSEENVLSEEEKNEEEIFEEESNESLDSFDSFSQTEHLQTIIQQNENLLIATQNNSQHLQTIISILIVVLIALVGQFVYKTLFRFIG